MWIWAGQLIFLCYLVRHHRHRPILRLAGYSASVPGPARHRLPLFLSEAVDMQGLGHVTTTLKLFLWWLVGMYDPGTNTWTQKKQII